MLDFMYYYNGCKVEDEEEEGEKEQTFVGE